MLRMLVPTCNHAGARNTIDVSFGHALAYLATCLYDMHYVSPFPFLGFLNGDGLSLRTAVSFLYTRPVPHLYSDFPALSSASIVVFNYHPLTINHISHSLRQASQI